MLVKDLMPPAPAELIIYVNGEFLPDSQAKISTLDHAFMYGDGCFDAWCGRNGFIYQLDDHLDRLYRSVAALKIRTSPCPDELWAKIVETVHRNAVVDMYIKVMVTRGSARIPSSTLGSAASRRSSSTPDRSSTRSPPRSSTRGSG
jgi:branched-subunit amino acid aminotransferase/4-amino-4-deoxychorismate lyase